MSNTNYRSQQLNYHNSTSLVRNYYTLHVIQKLKSEEKINNIRDVSNDNLAGGTETADKMHFMICQACFWCATCISPQLLRKMTRITEDSVSLTKCPFCVEGNVESIPIAENENYRFNYDAKRGLVMKFFR
jgi:hypothetical protein